MDDALEHAGGEIPAPRGDGTGECALVRMGGRFAVPSGVDVKTVSAILGHSNAAMTLNVYADALADSKKVIMGLMGRIISAGLS